MRGEAKGRGTHFSLVDLLQFQLCHGQGRGSICSLQVLQVTFQGKVTLCQDRKEGNVSMGLACKQGSEAKRRLV